MQEKFYQSRIEDVECNKAEREELDQCIIDSAVTHWRIRLHAYVKAFSVSTSCLDILEMPDKLFNRSILTVRISKFLNKCVVSHIVHHKVTRKHIVEYRRWKFLLKFNSKCDSLSHTLFVRRSNCGLAIPTCIQSLLKVSL